MIPITELESVRVYLSRIEATAVSIRSAVIRVYRGKYYEDVARITFLADGTVRVPEGLAPTEEEAKAIAGEIEGAEVPEHTPATNLKKLPVDIESSELFIFRDGDKRITMIQERIIDKKGDKQYIPWTYWSDNKWRMLEPEESLPLYNQESLEDSSVVFIHEGPKSVRNLLATLKGGSHPWQEELEDAAHVGWIGGALNPHRTNWAVLAKSGVTRAYIVADNDGPGLGAIKGIARGLRCVTWSIQFNDDFPSGFDLGDDFPDEMFYRDYYVGPSFRALVHPSTWMTDIIPPPKGEKGRPSHVLRKHAEDVWIFSEVSEQFVLYERPEVIRSESSLNKMLMSYSDAENTCRLIYKAQSSRKVNLAYRPDTLKRIIELAGTSAINTHIPCMIKPNSKIPIKPFTDFLEYLVPEEKERKNVEKWVATLIARPGVRVGFALLMISELQGVGKTTLGQNILKPLMGVINVSTPSEADIVSDYNHWIAHKRLAVVNEIYLGHGWKAYQSLQSIITDNSLMVNQKYVKQYEIDNWCHIYACSNSIRALKIKKEDRRWYVPRVSEERMPEKYWGVFNNWLKFGGLGAILAWAAGYGDYFRPGEHAPASLRKLEMIEDSESDSWKEARILGGVIMEFGPAIAVPMRDIMVYIKTKNKREVHESDAEIRKAMRGEGVFVIPERIKIDGARQYIIGNEALRAELSEMDVSESEKTKYIRDKRVSVNDLVSETM